MGEGIHDALYCMIAAFTYWFLIGKIYNEAKSRQKLIVTIIMGMVIFGLVYYGIVSEGWIIALESIYAFLIVRDRIADKLVNLLTAQLLVAVMADISRIFFLLLFNSSQNLFRVLTIVLVASIVICSCQFKEVKNVLSFLIGMRFGKKLICMLSMLVVMLIVSFGTVMLEMTEMRSLLKLYLGLVLLMLIAFSILLFMLLSEAYEHKAARAENEIKETIIHEQKVLYELLVEKNDDLRKFRHDIGNRLSTLSLLLDNGDYAEADNYLNDIVEQNNNLKVNQYFFGNRILDAILFMMRRTANEKGIELLVEGNFHVNPDDIYDICGLFSNALTNAIEACVGQSSNGPIEVKAQSTAAMQVLLFRNPATEVMYHNILNRSSSKEDKDNHGIGIRSIEESVHKMNGSFSYQYLDGFLELKIVI